LCAACAKPRRPVLEKDYSRPLPPGRMALRKITDPSMIPDFSDAFRDTESLLQAIDRSLDYFAHPSSQNYFPYADEESGVYIEHRLAVDSLVKFKEVLQQAQSGSDLQRLILAEFDVYYSVGCDGMGTVLFTGYCEPIYEGSLERTDVFRYPLYKRPPDLVSDPADGTILGRQTDGGLVPYYTRAQIDGEGVLQGQDLELVWLKDPMEAYIVTVQGSARFTLPDGSEFRVGYAGSNGMEYRSIGLDLVAEGKIPRNELSLRRIRQYFGDHPDQLSRYLFSNPRYIFFRQTTGGPYGSLNQVVTPYRSLATDKEVFPRGCLAYVETVLPMKGEGMVGRMQFRQFMLDQDTGGAIRSAGRGDIFMGTGPDAELLAGRTRHEGRLYYLFLKTPEVALAF